MLSDHHRDMLENKSGISPGVIAARGYWTCEDKTKLGKLGFAANQRRVPTLVVPLYRPCGVQDVSQARPDRPRRLGNRTMKYEYPWGLAPVIDVPPGEMMRATVRNPEIPLVITEGAKKADSAVSQSIPCISLAGVWNWRGTNEFGGKMTLSDLDDIAWNGRRALICYDSDVMTKAGVYSGMLRLAGCLKVRGAVVQFIVLPGESSEKMGLDDYLSSSKQAGDLYSLAVDKLAPPWTDWYRFNDMGVAHRIMDAYPEELVYDNSLGGWFVWGGQHWLRDKKGIRVQRLVTNHIETLYDEGLGLPETTEEERKVRKGFATYARGYGNARKIQGVEQLLRVNAVEDDTRFDDRVDLLNCSNGTYDLNTGEFYGHRPQDRLTVVCPTPFEPEAECPLWTHFMAERFPDPDTRLFIQRMCGLLVTGDAPEKAFFIVRGDPDCGKTVFVETLKTVLGDYAGKVAKTTLMKSKSESRQAEKSVALVGRRFVFVDESDRTDAIDASFIKEITGGESTLVARRLYEQEFHSRAQFTIILVTNFKPRMTGEDAALWRRCYLVEFGARIPKEEQVLGWGNRLKGEYPGILQWMIEGYKGWRAGGLAAPEEVVSWTEDYQRENDPLGKFMAENYCIEEGSYCFAKDVHLHFVAWAAEEDLNLQFLTQLAPFSKSVRNRFMVGDGTKRVENKRVFESLRRTVSFREFNEEEIL